MLTDDMYKYDLNGKSHEGGNPTLIKEGYITPGLPDTAPQQ
jgi:hypothetical protein